MFIRWDNSMKKTLSSIGKNVLIFCAAALVATGLFYVTKNPQIFQASILSLQEQTFVQEQGRDAAYKIQSGMFEIFIADKYSGSLEQLQSTLYIKPQETILYPEQYTGQGRLSNLSQKSDTISFTITLNPPLESAREIIGIPLSGDQKNFVLGETKAYIHKQRINLSVGNLKEYTGHSTQ